MFSKCKKILLLLLTVHRLVEGLLFLPDKLRYAEPITFSRPGPLLGEEEELNRCDVTRSVLFAIKAYESI